MLYIYSGEVAELDHMLLERLGAKHVLTIIPASPKDMASAKSVTRYFRHVGFSARLQSARFYRDPDRLWQIVHHSDAVFLAGGNTFEFLAFAYRVGLFEILAEFEAAGGVIMSESAGSIILSPNIATALIPTTCADDHTLELESYHGMGRIPFHISPHYDPHHITAEQELTELQALVNVSGLPVYILQDGEGLVIEGEQVVHKVGEPLELQVNPEAPVRMEVLPEWAADVNVSSGAV